MGKAARNRRIAYFASKNRDQSIPQANGNNTVVFNSARSAARRLRRRGFDVK